MIMTTIYLKYRTLKQVLDAKKGTVVLVKKRPVSYISNILTFIPLDVCKIINTYYNEEIKFDTEDGIAFSKEGYRIALSYMKDYQGSMVHVYGFSTMSAKIMDTYCIGLLYCMNEYMKCEYNKLMYIHQCAKDSFEYMYGQNECIRDSVYIRKKNYLATYEYVYEDELSNTSETIIIVNHRQFKHDIVMTKCLINGLHKYYSSKI